MYVFEVLFLYFRENRAVFSSSSAWIVRTCVEKKPAIKFHKNHTLEDDHDGNGEILYKTLTKWRWRLLKTSLLCSRKLCFGVKTFHPFNDRSSPGFQSFPDKSRKNVTNEVFQELRKITSILLPWIIGDPYFFNHESLTLLTIYKIW